MRPLRLLDLFCGAGGCSVGYARAGFEVYGVDNRPMPRYPFPERFEQRDAMEALQSLIDGGTVCGLRLADVDAIHASPPCQRYTPLRALCKGKEYPDLLAPTRDLLNASGKPWVIENVPGAPVESGIVLCGTMFSLRVYRHRYFECSFFPWSPAHPQHKVLAGEKGTKGGRRRKAHYESGGFITVAGDVGSYCGQAMGIDWMIGKELSQAIPPAYTEFVGRQLADHCNYKRTVEA